MKANEAITFPSPYLVYVGDVTEEDCCKTGFGLVDWAGSRVLGQVRSTGEAVSLGVADLSVEQGARAGARSLVIGIAGVGGKLSPTWYEDLKSAARAGLHIVSGAHQGLAEVPGLCEIAAASGAQLVEVRSPAARYPIGTGKKRPGKRLLTVGTDCALGKKYTALSIARAMTERAMDATFRATGQTGIMLAGGGIPIDAVVSDFVAGAAESLSPAASATHWDIIEGQGSLIHPGYAAVTLGLLHGSQPDEIVLCHDTRRSHNLDSPQVLIPPLLEVVDIYLTMGRLTNPDVTCRAISLNTRGMSEEERTVAIELVRKETGLITFDPLVTGVSGLVDALQENA